MHIMKEVLSQKRRLLAALAVACVAIVAGPLRMLSEPARADVDDQTQLVMLSNALLSGTYALPQQPQVQRLAIYHDYALVQLNTQLPQATGTGAGSFVAQKTHHNWEVLARKAGSYSQSDLVAAGIPSDAASGLLQFLNPPRPLPSP